MTSNKNYVLSISIIGVLFFIFGFVTWLNGTLIPFLKLACDLKTDAEALLVTFAFYMAYFFLAIPSSFILTKTGFKKGMSLGLAVMAVGALLFLPAAMQRSFSLFLTGLFVQGMGLALLQTASNPYISVIGPIESAAKRISIMGICNKVAGALSPLILGAIVLQDATGIEGQINATTDLATKTGLLQALSERVIVPYAIMAAVLIALAVMIWLSPLPEIETDGSTTIDNKTKYKNIFQVPYLMLGILCLFLYVGVEVMAGDVIGTYGKAIGIGLDETKGLYIHCLHCLVGFCQCLDVAGYFSFGDRKPWKVYKTWFSLTGHGNCRWSGAAPTLCSHRTNTRPTFGFFLDCRTLLCLYLVLRNQGTYARKAVVEKP